MGNPQGTLNATNVEIGWLAGIIDGEGAISFSVYKAPRYRDIRVKPQVVINSTNRAITDRVVQVCERLGVGAHFSIRDGAPHQNAFKATRYKPFYAANISGFKRVARLLPCIVEHLTDPKKTLANMILRYIEQRLRKTAERGRWASIDLEDAELMLEIVTFARANRSKGPATRNISDIEGLLRDLEQNRDSTTG